MVKKNILICIDRDGTLIYDDKYYLGKQRNWKSLIKFLPGVIQGIKLLRKKLPEAKIYFISNQPGVAIKNFSLLTEQKANYVSAYIMYLLKKRGAALDGYEFCPNASLSYVKKHPDYKFHKRFVGNSPCIKPRPGMIKSILKKEGWKKENTQIYVIGDRVSDVKAALSVNGTGILIPFEKEPGNEEKFKKIKSKKKFLAKNFLDASKFILK